MLTAVSHGWLNQSQMRSETKLVTFWAHLCTGTAYMVAIFSLLYFRAQLEVLRGLYAMVGWTLDLLSV